MASKSLISRNTRFSKFREHVRRWAFERTKDDALKIVMRAADKEDRAAVGKSSWPIVPSPIPMSLPVRSSRSRTTLMPCRTAASISAGECAVCLGDGHSASAQNPFCRV